MKYQVTYHHAQQALENPEIQTRLNQLFEVVDDWVVPSYPGKSTRQDKIDLVHPILNAMAELWLTTVDWEVQGALDRLTDGKEREKGTVDFFCKLSDGRYIAVEVQFGNGGRVERDFSKLTKLHRHGLLALGVLMYFDRKTAVTADSGLGVYETVCARKDELGTAPSVILGVSREDTPVVDLRELQGIIHPSVLGGSGKGTVKLHEFIARAVIERTPLSQVRLTPELREIVAAHGREHSEKLAADLQTNVERILKCEDGVLRQELLAPLLEVLKSSYSPVAATEERPRRVARKQPTVQEAADSVCCATDRAAAGASNDELPHAPSAPGVSAVVPAKEAVAPAVAPKAVRITKAQVEEERRKQEALRVCRSPFSSDSRSGRGVASANNSLFDPRRFEPRPFSSALAHAFCRALN